MEPNQQINEEPSILGEETSMFDSVLNLVLVLSLIYVVAIWPIAIAFEFIAKYSKETTSTIMTMLCFPGFIVGFSGFIYSFMVKNNIPSRQKHIILKSLVIIGASAFSFYMATN